MDCCLGGCCLAGLAAWLRCHLKATGVWRDRPRGPLKGVKVLDLSQALSGPYASKLLADMGAEVIRVDDAGHPDLLQYLGPSPGLGMAGAWMTANAGKRSLVLDLQKGGIEVFRRLAKTADIVLQSFPPGAAEELGVGYEAVRSLRPDVVYVSISGFGPTGPRAGTPAYEPLVQCLSGLCEEQADEFGPQLVPTALASKLTSLTVAQAAVAALVARDRGAGGQHVEVSMLESLLQCLWPDNYSGRLWQVPCPEGQPPPHIFHRLWRTKDAERNGAENSGSGAGRRHAAHLALGVTSDQEWLALCNAIQRPDLAGDPRFATAGARAEHLAEWVREVQATLSAMSGEAALDALEREGVPHAPVLSQDDVLADVQARDAELFVRLRHSFLGAFRQPRFPCDFGETAASGPTRAPAPVPGEHSAKILAEVGFEAAEASSLLGSGTVLDSVALAERADALHRHVHLLRLFGSLQKLDRHNHWTAEGPALSKVGEAQAANGVDLMRAEGPFAGLQILEVGSGLDIGLAGAILADQGADVVKVEFVPALDPARGQGPAPAEGMGAVHMATNRGKRSVVVNPKNPRAYDVLEDLVKNADAIIINLPVEQAAELGLSYYELQQKRKGLVYVSVSGFNSRGPRFWEPGHDCLVQALAGGAAACLDRRGEPSLVSTHLADKVTAMFAALSLGAACRMQLRGVVQQVELDKFACMVNFNFPDLFHSRVWERSPSHGLGAWSLSDLWRLVDSSDRQAGLCVAAVSDAEFRGLCEALGHREWLQLEGTGMLESRLFYAPVLATAMEPPMKAMDSTSIAEACERHGVPYAPVLGINDCLQVLESEMFEDAHHPAFGSYRLPRHAARFSATPARGRTPAPAPGEGMIEHMDACGYDRLQLRALVADGAVAAPRPPELPACWDSTLWHLGLGPADAGLAWKQAGSRAVAFQGAPPQFPRPSTEEVEAPRRPVAPTGAVVFAI